MLRKIFFWVIAIAVIKSLGQIYIDDRKTKNTYKALAESAPKLNETLPTTIADGRLQLDRVELSDHIARFSGQQLWRKELTEQEKTDLKEVVKTVYCGEGGKLFVHAKVAVEYNFKTQARTLSDLSTETWTISFKPEQCT